MRILVLGSGGREHAMARALQSNGDMILVAPGNGGVIAFATPDNAGPPAAANAVFTLYDKPQREWRKWKDPAFR
jgi:phosphoribosylamine-glycine ligase